MWESLPSDFAGDLENWKCTIGYVFTLAGGAVSWVSKLQTVVALSTTKVEYMAATLACVRVYTYGTYTHV